MARRIEKYYPLAKSKFYELQQTYLDLTDTRERAAVFYVLNRCSFSGTTLSGGMSLGHKRFTLSAIERIRNFKAGSITVKALDFKQSLKLHKEKDFLYVDPPYANGQALYGARGDRHKRFNHESLCECLKQRPNWVLSYNDCELVRELYRGYTFERPMWNYGMNNSKQSNEVLILSRELVR